MLRTSHRGCRAIVDNARMNSTSSVLAAVLLTQVWMSACADDQLTEHQWQPLQSRDGSVLTARHEAAGVVVGDAIYLIGGRDNRPVERYSVTSGQWENLGLAPLELHHVQPVVLGTDIVLAGAFTCCYPEEKIVAEMHVFDTLTDTWRVGDSMPVDRLRGSTAAVAHQGRLYLLGGNTRGHSGGAVAWFDEYDPATGNWRTLPDAPNARDHFSAVMIGNELVAAAGRQSSMPNPADNPVQAVDIYDFDTGLWRSVSAIPTPRGGAVAVAHGQEVIVAGGEINTSSVALNVVEAYDVVADQWRSLSSMSSGRHGSGGGVIDNRLLMLSGASRIGGSHETDDAEMLQLSEIADAVDSPAPETVESVNPPESGEATDDVEDEIEVEGDVADDVTDHSEAEQGAGQSSSSVSRGGAGGPLLLMALTLTGLSRYRQLRALK